MATQAERRDKTKTAIVKAARRIFGERGFAAATMDDVAAGARVAKGAVYHHFATKEAVFEAVFEQVSLELVSDLDRITRDETAPRTITERVAPLRAIRHPLRGPHRRSKLLAGAAATTG